MSKPYPSDVHPSDVLPHDFHPSHMYNNPTNVRRARVKETLRRLAYTALLSSALIFAAWMLAALIAWG